MGGIEGYFGPQLTDEDLVEEFGFKPYSMRRPQRPTNIDLSGSSRPGVSSSVRMQPGVGNSSPLDFPSTEEDETLNKSLGSGLQMVTIVTENLLSYPFVVLRRQCQVNHTSKKYHLVPITLIPIIMRLQQRQGITTLWKGIGSVLVVRGLTLGIEDILSKITSWPKDVSWHTDSIKTICQHILLKSVTLCIITPFYSASLVETVQSDIASEKPGVFDVFREGLFRLVRFSSPHKGRMLPVWALVIPTVVHGVFKYLFGSFVKNVSSSALQINFRKNYEKKGACPKYWFNDVVMQEIEASAQLISLAAADIVFYPLETILHRLHLQGTRTIIDNLDDGIAVTPILTNYDGMVDCYDTSLSQEGNLSLFKGLGALILQFTAHYAVLKLTKFVVTQLTVLLKSGSPPPLLPPPPPPHPSHLVSVMPPKTPTSSRQTPVQSIGTPLW